VVTLADGRTERAAAAAVELPLGLFFWISALRISRPVIYYLWFHKTNVVPPAPLLRAGGTIFF
jgi:hypothetical protein